MKIFVITKEERDLLIMYERQSIKEPKNQAEKVMKALAEVKVDEFLKKHKIRIFQS